MTERSAPLMAGIPELVILTLLAGREMYGYEIARAIKLVSKDSLRIGEGVLYPALHAMEARHLVRTRSVHIEGRGRIYYRLTASGKTRLERLSTDWRRMSAGVMAVLGERT